MCLLHEHKNELALATSTLSKLKNKNSIITLEFDKLIFCSIKSIYPKSNKFHVSYKRLNWKLIHH